MSKRTKKAGRAGRFGPRYGLNVRRRIRAIEGQQFADHACPQCLTGKLKRLSTAIWGCRKCGHKFAGGAYVPSTGLREKGTDKVKLGASEEVIEAAQAVVEEADEPEEAEAPEELTPRTAAEEPTEEPDEPAEEP